jgi:murein DD-endopeptidase MepM/ murein hydrolase activator NlpD
VPPGAPAAKPGVARRPTWTLIAVAPSLSAGVRRFELRRWYLRGAVTALVTLLIAAAGGGYALGERGDAEQLETAYGMLTDADITAAALGDTLRALRIAAALSPTAGATAASAEPSAGARTPRPVARVVLPVLGGRVSSGFARARRHPILGIWRSHDGLDISAPTGTPIRSPAGGRVVRVERQLGYGLLVEVSHGGGVITRYAHCSAARVSVGQRVGAGAVIATVGSSGLASGPHLHYEVLVRGRRVNPARYPVSPGR